MVRARIKIPQLCPTEKIKIEGNKIELRGYKAADKEFEIAVKHLRNEAMIVQGKLNRIIRTEEGEIKPDKDFTEEEFQDLIKLYDEIDEIANQMLYDENGEMKGPLALLAQRGLKRFYYPGKTSSELDEIEDIEITEGDAKLIGNTMISLANPPRGLKKSIQAVEKEQDDDKGKSEKE